MPYVAQLLRTQTYTITVQAENLVALTVFNMRRDRISEIESLVLDPTVDPNGTASTGPRTIAGSVSRVLIFASAEGGTGTLTVSQVGQTNPATTMSPDTSVVCDVV